MKRILIPLCLVVGSHMASGQRSYQFDAPNRLFVEGKERLRAQQFCPGRAICPIHPLPLRGFPYPGPGYRNPPIPRSPVAPSRTPGSTPQPPPTPTLPPPRPDPVLHTLQSNAYLIDIGTIPSRIILLIF